MRWAKSVSWVHVFVVLCAFAPPAFSQVNPAALTRASTSQATLTSTYKSYNRSTGETVYEVSATNGSAAALQGPVYLLLESLTGSGVTVKNAAGVAMGGAWYYALGTGDFAAGETRQQRVILGNPSNVRLSFTPVVYYTPPVTPSGPLTVVITQPATLITVGSTPLSIAGTVSDASATLTVNGAPVSISGGRFQASVALEEGHNTIVARAVKGSAESTATLSVSLDLTPPYLTVESPADGSVVTSRFIAVSGLINDIVRGTVSEGQANVTVNGKAAAVSNRSYLAENIELVEGLNTLTVQGADQVGNTSSVQTQVTYKVPGAKHIELSSGQGQRARIRTALGQPLRVLLLDELGNPAVNKPVVFRVTEGDGEVGVGGADESQAVLRSTDSNGLAATRFKVGSRAGSGNNHVTAKAVGFEGEVQFIASADPNAGDKVSVNSGNNQRGGVNQPLPLPLVVTVTDDGANVIKDSPIEFTVTAGGGKFQNGNTSYTATTDSDGRASATLTLGETPGLDVQRVTATLMGTPLYAGFTASALISGDAGQTSISGVVLDNQDHPLPNVTVRVENTTRQAQSNAQGQFRITEAPVGPVHLIADGSTTTVAGEWPTLPYNLVTVAGADNPLPAPIYMVKLDTEHAVWVGKDDQILTVAELPGFALTVKKGSVTFPNGDREGYLSVTPVNASKIPMAPPNGMQPQLIVTIQPTGARFDPPAPLQLPNVDGHAPGAQVEMYSFDHDLEEFVSIGLGSVSADGAVIKSNTGIGVIKAGWHCGSQPTGGGCAANCPICQDCDSACNCVAKGGDPRLSSLNTSGDCKKPECDNGSPKQVNDDSDKPTDTAGDCKKPECQNGAPNQANDDSDKPTTDTAGDCKKPGCLNGALHDDPDDADKPPNKPCQECKNAAIANLPDDPTIPTPGPSAGPAAVQDAGDAVALNAFGANSGQGYTLAIACKKVCKAGEEQFGIDGDITPAAAWTVVVHTKAQLPGCGAITRTAANIARTTTHESKHATFLMSVINGAKADIGKLFGSSADCETARTTLTTRLATDWNAMVARQIAHTDFVGETRYGFACQGGITTEIPTGTY